MVYTPGQEISKCESIVVRPSPGRNACACCGLQQPEKAVDESLLLRVEDRGSLSIASTTPGLLFTMDHLLQIRTQGSGQCCMLQNKGGKWCVSSSPYSL